MINKNLLQRFAALSAAVIFATASASAQSTTQGAISGTVFDATDAAIPNATVLIHNDGTNADITVKGGDSGEFRAPLLAPGTYTVTVSAANFATQKTSGVVVQVNEVTAVMPHLTTGSAASEVVEVTAQIPVLRFDSPEFGGHLDNKEIENIPINNRRWSSLALTTPGVTNDPSGFGLLSFRALPSVLNNVQIDGVDDNQAFFGEERGRTRAGYSTSQVAVREFQVNTGVYSAELGRAVGGVVNSVTKQGSNVPHGEIYFYHRGDDTSSKNEKTTLTTLNSAGAPVSNVIRPKDKRNQYGFGVGGPLIKDKLFGFYAFDAFRRNFPGIAVSGSPSSLYNGSACSTAVLAATGATAAQCNAALVDLEGDLGQVPRFGNQLINTPKLTYQINSKNTLDILYHRLRWDSPGGVQTQAALSYAPDAFGTDFVKLDYGVAKLNSILGSHFTNELRYQYARELNDEGQQAFTSYTTRHLVGGNGVVTYASLNTASGGFNIGSPYYSYRVAYPDERKWQIGDTAAYLVGKHTIRFGGDFVHNYDLQNNLFQSNGAYSYASVANYLADVLRPGAACTARTTSGTPTLVASAAVAGAGCFSSEVQGFGPTTFDLATLDTAYFAQDDWKVMPNLTINLGVRYDYEALPSPYANAVNPLAPQESNRPSDKNNIAPRIGFAFDPFGKGKSVIRGGFGMYYGRIPNGVLLNAFTNTGTVNGQSQYTTYNGTNIGTTAAPAFLTFPNTLVTRPAVAPLLSVQYLDKNLQNPYTEQFDLTIQHDLGRNNVVSISYLGSLGKELPNYINTNLNPSNFYTETYTLVAGNGNTTCVGAPCGTTFTQKVYNNAVQNSSFFAVTDTISNANSNYHAMSIDVTNRANKYITFDANYTYAHALDYNVTSFTSNGTNNYIDPYDPTSSYGNSAVNIRHRAVGWAILNIPGIKEHNLLSYATNGWSIKPLIQVQSGLPYSIAISSGSPTSLTTGTGTTAVTQSAFSSGISGTGVSGYIPFFGRNNQYVPRNIVIDSRIQKDFRIREGATFQLLAEAFNLANHRNITAVNTGAYTLTGTAGSGQGTLTTAAPNFFGQPSSSGVNGNYAYQVRQFQFGGRIIF